MDQDQKVAYRKTLNVGDRVDIVSVCEQEHVWIKGPWCGTVTKIYHDFAVKVKPDSYEQKWRVKPNPEYFAGGLYLTLNDDIGSEI